MTYGKRILLACFLVTFSWYLTSCIDEKDPVSVTTHSQEWSNPGSDEFHGKAILSKSLGLESCQSCHGETYMGGTSQVSCYESGCHQVYPHPDGIANPAADQFHGKILEGFNWNLDACVSCHGDDYGGKGIVEKNCLSCHRERRGPRNCTTCHGGENAAPPRSLDDATATSDPAVGAHQLHYAGDRWSTFNSGTCGTCHDAFAGFSSASHLDAVGSPRTPADVQFDAFTTANGQNNTAYDGEINSCSDVYCHGAFEFRRDDSQYPWAYTEDVMSGNNDRVFWNQLGVGQAACGSCHGLPLTGHIAADLNTCGTCHSRVVDNNLNIINKYLHINGQVEVF